MVDFILVVDDPLSWHAEVSRWIILISDRINGIRYYSDVTPGLLVLVLLVFPVVLLMLPTPAAFIPFPCRVDLPFTRPTSSSHSRQVVAAADRVGVGVHFNPTSTSVVAFTSLYCCLSVEILIPHDHILSLQSHNLRAAVAAALLLFPQTFTEHELYEAICRISYTGDVRMALAEDPNKISRIVAGGFHHFRSLYRSSLQHFVNSGCLHCIPSTPAESSGTGLQNNRLIGQEISTTCRQYLIQHIPASIRASLSHRLLPTPPYLPRSPFPSHSLQSSALPISKTWEQKPTNQTPIHPSIAMSAALSRRLALSVSRKVLCAELAAELARRVRIASARQAIAGVLAAGPAHAMRYLSKKLAKAWVKA
ncbi:unnamed protein product [Closterium sp. NIES-54]